MIYLSQLLGDPVYDLDGEKIGVVNDLGIATGEVFPRVTSLAVEGPGKTPFMVSWRKYVDTYSDDEIRLKVVKTDIRFSYLQPDEVLIARDLLNKQIVDTLGMRVVRVNDLKLSDTSSTQLRLIGAEVGVRGILRTLSPTLERVALRVAKAFGKTIPERIIAWNYMDLLERDLSNVKLSVSHKTLDDMHPADIADIIERLDPRLRGQVFAQLDDEQAADVMAEIEDDKADQIVDGMDEKSASRMLSEMDPDDAAELVGELDYDRAEKLLRLMGVHEQQAIRQLLGYREDTAGRIMTSEVVSLPQSTLVEDAIAVLKALDENFESVHYIYATDDDGRLSGVVPLNALIVAEPTDKLRDLMTSELVTASPEDDQEDVALDISKYNLLAMPVVDDDRKLLGIVTVDDALDVLEEEHEQDLQIAGGSSRDGRSRRGHDFLWLLRQEAWSLFWLVGTAIMLVAGGPDSLVLVQALAMPAALILADDSVSYVINYYLEYDEDDESAPSFAGFALKGLVLGVLFAAVIAMGTQLLANAFIDKDALSSAEALVGSTFTKGFVAAAVSIVVSFATAPIYLTIIRRRDDRGLDTSRYALTFTALAIALAIFVGISLAFQLGGLWVS